MSLFVILKKFIDDEFGISIIISKIKSQFYSTDKFDHW
jgi:hypothetical protein